VKVDAALAERLYATLRETGMSQVPEGFSVARLHQEIPPATLAEIDGFVRVFDRVTTRRVWQQAVTASAPEIARRPGREVCFFSAWDFHLPPDHPERWQLIEFNDNGSGFLFAAHINHAFYEVFGLADRAGIEPPVPFSDFAERVAGLVEREARGVFGARAAGLLVVVDDASSFERGRFRDELVLLRDLLRRRGWPAEIAPPEALRWNGARLALEDREVCFVVNRSTDFFWQGEATASLRIAWGAGRVYVAPNPFTYATRSDKCLLELLSRPDRDAELGVRPEERALLGAHVPETRPGRAPQHPSRSLAPAPAAPQGRRVRCPAAGPEARAGRCGGSALVDGSAGLGLPGRTLDALRPCLMPPGRHRPRRSGRMAGDLRRGRPVVSQNAIAFLHQRFPGLSPPRSTHRVARSSV
jgi:hypothetical protein